MRQRRLDARTIAAVGAIALTLAASSGLAAVAVTRSIAVALIAAGAAAATVATAVSVEAGILVLIFVACTDGLLKGISPGWHTQVLKDYFLAISVLRWIWLSVLGSRRMSVQQPMVPALLAFAGWCAVQIFNARTQSYMLALAGFRAWVIWIVIFFLTYDYLRTRRQVERLVVFITVLLIPISIYAIVQYDIGYEHLYRLGPGFEEYERFSYVTVAEGYQAELRPPSTMVQPHNLAAAMSCVLLLAAAAIFYFRAQRAYQIVALASLPLFVAAMLITGTRTAVAGTAVGVLAVLLLIRRPTMAVVFALVAILGATQVDRLTGGKAVERLSMLVTEPMRARNRVLGQWYKAVDYARTHPLGSGVGTGVGAGRLIWAGIPRAAWGLQPPPWAENEFGRALIELGVPGLLIYLWMLYAVMRAMVRSYVRLREPRDRWLAAGMIGACVGVLTRLLVGSALYSWPEAIFFWIFVAAAARLPHIEASEDESRLAPELASQARQVAK